MAGGRRQPDADPRTRQPSLSAPEPPSPTLEGLRALAPDDLTPRQALALLYALKALEWGTTGVWRLPCTGRLRYPAPPFR